MQWLERHAWWGLLVVALTMAAFGVTDAIAGAAADPAIALALTGLSPDELRAESAPGYRLYDFMTRINGWSLVLGGLGLAAILAFAFRHGRRWAWWTLWLLPIWSAGAALFYVVAGTEPSQAPPPPMVSGPIIAVLTAAILGVTARRFFRAD